MKGRRNKRTTRRYIETGNDADDVLACYRRIYGQLQRLSVRLHFCCTTSSNYSAAQRELIDVENCERAGNGRYNDRPLNCLTRIAERPIGPSMSVVVSLLQLGAGDRIEAWSMYIGNAGQRSWRNV